MTLNKGTPKNKTAKTFVVTPSGVIFKETPEGVTTNIWMIYFLQSPKYPGK